MLRKGFLRTEGSLRKERDVLGREGVEEGRLSSQDCGGGEGEGRKKTQARCRKRGKVWSGGNKEEKCEGSQTRKKEDTGEGKKAGRKEGMVIVTMLQLAAAPCINPHTQCKDRRTEGRKKGEKRKGRTVKEGSYGGTKEGRKTKEGSDEGWKGKK